ncbi:hypothetical protein AB0C34_17510 [Nocardia sp. NPDC049220]|uniref:hypothetical protein n=1 Tax=Nocardia sp. NPDC049220 TaxID=3155273 RepID=UPI0033FD6870
MLTAWGDESGSQPGNDPGTYILSAVLLDDTEEQHVRAEMQALQLPGEKKLHWHSASADQRLEFIEVVASLPVCGIVAVHHSADADDRRHRRKCLEYLLPHLAYLNCGSLTLESRGGADASDYDIVQKFRAQRVLTADLRLGHRIGRDEPVLWTADIVCGAVVQHRVGNSTYLDKLGGMIEMRSI